MRAKAALEDYLRNHAPRMRAQGIERFGDRFTAQRRVLQHREEFERGAVSTENCLNCGEVLTGQHCSHCGQRARVRVLSLSGMLKELLGDLTDYDSRIWRTLRPLAFRPGQLTTDYLRGRRATYTPPFRLYLILSLAFFLVASLSDVAKEGIRFKLDNEGNANLQLGLGEAPPAQAPPVAAPKPLDPVVALQRNWIGRSEGAELTFVIDGTGDEVPVFTTRPDTLWGVTFFVFAVEHPLVPKLAELGGSWSEVQPLLERARAKPLTVREEADTKEGVPLGVFAVNPVNGEKVPCYVAPYVLMEYGTGAIMAVPAHDERDFAFAREHDLPVRVVIQTEGEAQLGGDTMPEAYAGDGVMVSSGPFDGERTPESIAKVAAWLEDRGKPYEKAAAMAKMYASDVTMRAAVEGVQILGGYGYCKEYPMETVKW